MGYNLKDPLRFSISAILLEAGFSVKLGEIQRCLEKIRTNIWTHTTQNMCFTRCQNFDELWYLRAITSFSET